MTDDPSDKLGFAPDHDAPIQYMRRTREYYLALGYDNPYRWAHYTDAPFTPLARPLKDCTLALISTAKLYEVQKYCSLTNHSWDGFWFVANKSIWQGVPADVQQVISRHINAAARRQRDDIARANLDLQKQLESKGLVFNTVDTTVFRKSLQSTGFYAQVKDKFGPEAWALLQPFVNQTA